ncbi:3-hydroxyacyl-ACP dehydratase FabZ [bacterium]|nr:MAG: 3-hydroxyacyl-ACP dehydratase FabZ [bacterium]
MVDIRQILETLPHRYPMLLVDRLVERSEDGRTCRGLKNVTINEPFFQGHYPGKPIMPGVLLLECMAQVGCAAIMLNPTLANKVPLIGAIDAAKFRRMVVPGDQLIVDVEILWIRGAIGKMKAEAKVEGEVAASMEMTFMLQQREL